MNTRQKLKALRTEMQRVGVDAYLIPSTDPHQSEYVPACWQRRQWVSGFSGSAGDLVLTLKGAGLWTDGRYFLQAAEELRGSTIKLFKQGRPGVPSVSEHLALTLGEGQALGLDPRLISQQGAAELEAALGAAGARVKMVEENLVDRIWDDQPPRSDAPLEVRARKHTGETVAAKLKRLRAALKERGASAHVVTTLDAIAWLFNVRSADVAYNPVAIAYAVVTADRALLFVDQVKVTPAVRQALAPQVEVRPYSAVATELKRLKRERATVWADPRTTNLWVLSKLERSQLITDPTPIARMKAAKNEAEVAGMREAHLRDGVALVRFLRWLEQVVPDGGATEVSAAARLRELRAEGEHFRGESFATIVGYGAHGAIIHYEATEATDAPLRPAGLLLVDSGGQYLDGTTDITRTILLGKSATREHKDRYTRVLRGHIALSRVSFPAGTAGRQIDVLARAPLWEMGLNYAHGTGHGVGAFLNVHEGPQSIHPLRCTGVPLEEGNVLSIEPGYYKEGGYGIRIENLAVVVRDEERSHGEEVFLRFDPITLCPIDTRMVDVKALAAAERSWLNAYHDRVRDALTPRLDQADARWLKRATKRV